HLPQRHDRDRGHRLLYPAVTCAARLLSIALILCAACDVRRGGPPDDAAADAATSDAGACARPFTLGADTAHAASGLRINEALSANDGVNVDALGETDDWIELINETDAPIALAG